MTANDFKDPTLVCYAIENHPCDSRVTLTDNGIDSPTFNVSFSLMNDIMRHEYTLHGYIGDYGDVNITSCSFTRKIRKDGETEFKTVSEFLIREELDSFTFDR